MAGHVGPCCLTSRRDQVDETDERVVDLPPGKATGPTDDEVDPDAVVGEIAHVAGELQAVVAKTDDQGVVGQSVALEGIEDGAVPLIHDAGGSLESGGLGADLRGVGQGARRQAITLIFGRVIFRIRVRIRDMGFVETQGQEEGLTLLAIEEVDDRSCGRRVARHVGIIGVVSRQDPIVTDGLGVGCRVLHACLKSEIAVGLQNVGQMQTVVGHREIPMRQSEHAADVRIGAGQKCSAAWRTSGRRRKGAPEEHPLLGEALQIWSGHGVAKRLDELPGVVRVHEDDVGGLHGQECPHKGCLQWVAVVSDRYSAACWRRTHRLAWSHGLRAAQRTRNLSTVSSFIVTPRPGPSGTLT